MEPLFLGLSASARVAAMRGVRQESFASLITRLNDRIVVRVPLKEN